MITTSSSFPLIVPKTLVPTFNPPDDCRILLIPRDGYVEPKSVAVAYTAAACDRGATVHTRVEATGLVINNGRGDRCKDERRRRRNAVGRTCGGSMDTQFRSATGPEPPHRAGTPSGICHGTNHRRNTGSAHCSFHGTSALRQTRSRRSAGRRIRLSTAKFRHERLSSQVRNLSIGSRSCLLPATTRSGRKIFPVARRGHDHTGTARLADDFSGRSSDPFGTRRGCGDWLSFPHAESAVLIGHQVQDEWLQISSANERHGSTQAC